MISSPIAPQTLTFEARLSNALADIRNAGVRVRQNVTTQQVDALAEHTGLLLWTDARQGAAYTFRDGLPYYVNALRKKNLRTWDLPSSAKVKTLFFNHGGPEGEAARIAANAFRAHGLAVEWDGTPFRSVQVHTPFADQH